MKVEIEIRRILCSPNPVSTKIENINKIVNWDSKKLKDSIEKHGTSSNERRGKIIVDFWGVYRK